MGQGGGITVLIRSWTSGVMWLNFGVLVLPSENACLDSWNPGKQCTPWLNEGEGLFDSNTFVQKFLVRATRSHHSSCQISVPEFFPAFQRDSGASAKKAHERAILIVRFVFEKGRYDVVDSEWLQLGFNCNLLRNVNTWRTPHRCRQGFQWVEGKHYCRKGDEEIER